MASLVTPRSISELKPGSLVALFVMEQGISHQVGRRRRVVGLYRADPGVTGTRSS